MLGQQLVEVQQLAGMAEVVEVAGQKALLEQQLVQVVRQRASLEVQVRALVEVQ